MATFLNLLYLQPEQLRLFFDFGIPEEPETLDVLLQDCRDTLTYRVNTGRTVVTSQLQENVRHVLYRRRQLRARAACLPYSGIEKG